MDQYPNGPQQPYPPQEGRLNYQQPPGSYPQVGPYSPQPQQLVKKKSKVLWVVLGIIGTLVLCGAIANAGKSDTNTQSTTSDQPQQVSPTIAPSPTSTPILKPASRATIDQIEKDLAAPEDPIIERYNEQTGELHVAQQFGWAVTLTSDVVKKTVSDHMKGYFDVHKDANVSSVTVTIYQYSQNTSNYVAIARATMTRSTAQSMSWLWISDSDVWSKCSNTWIDPSIV